MSEDELEDRLQIQDHASAAAALETLAERLADEAGRLFARRCDDVALYLRDSLLPEVEETARRHRDEQRRREAEYKADYEDGGDRG